MGRNPYRQLGMDYPRPGDPVVIKAANPLPQNAERLDTGNAGLDGYTVLARASRYDGVRRPTDYQEPEWSGPMED